MKQEDWPKIQTIFEMAINSNLATLEQQAPSYEFWDKTHLPMGRLVAQQEDGEVIGYAAMSPASFQIPYCGVVEDEVAVAEDARGEGVGKALLTALVESADKNELWTLEAHLLEENEAAIALHQACGFRTVGRQLKRGMDAYGHWRNVLLMERRSEKVGSVSCEGCDGTHCRF